MALMATISPVLMFCAFSTSENVPAPMGFANLYFFIVFSAGEARQGNNEWRSVHFIR